MSFLKRVNYQVIRPIVGLRFQLTRKLADREPSDVWPGLGSTAVTIRPRTGQFGNVTPDELMVLCGVARVTGARRVFEFGTFDGLTTWHLAANTPDDARIWSLDLPLDHPARVVTAHDRTVGKIHGVGVGGQYEGTPEARKVSQLYSDSLALDPEPFRGQIDLCFIDAGHGYEHVSTDTRNALVMVRPGGTIIWHDYSRWWPGVQKCLDDLKNTMPVFRISRTSLGALRVPA
jgi:Methyltransferase domain